MNCAYVEYVFDETILKKYWTSVKPLMRNNIEVGLTRISEDLIKIGRSKLGGQPDLPPTITWPREPSGASLSFIGQINLADACKFDRNQLLPLKGWLYFFYSVDQPWGFDPQDAGKFSVIFHDGPVKELKRVDFPDDLPEDARFNSCRMGFDNSVSLPSWGNDPIHRIIDDEEAWDLYCNRICKKGLTKLLGYADIVQGEMELECALTTNGLYCGDSSGYNDPRAAEFKIEQDQWQLLFQIDSREKAGMMWGDGGLIYFWIKKGDLRKQDFSKCWVILQCD